MLYIKAFEPLVIQIEQMVAQLKTNIEIKALCGFLSLGLDVNCDVYKELVGGKTNPGPVLVIGDVGKLLIAASKTKSLTFMVYKNPRRVVGQVVIDK